MDREGARRRACAEAVVLGKRQPHCLFVSSAMSRAGYDYLSGSRPRPSSHFNHAGAEGALVRKDAGEDGLPGSRLWKLGSDVLQSGGHHSHHLRNPLTAADAAAKRAAASPPCGRSR